MGNDPIKDIPEQTAQNFKLINPMHRDIMLTKIFVVVADHVWRASFF